MTRSEIITWLSSRGYRQIRPNSSSYYKDGVPDTRYTLGSLVLRKEGRTENTTWFRLRSAYISQLTVNEKNQLIGMVR